MALNVFLVRTFIKDQRGPKLLFSLIMQIQGYRQKPVCLKLKSGPLKADSTYQYLTTPKEMYNLYLLIKQIMFKKKNTIVLCVVNIRVIMM